MSVLLMVFILLSFTPDRASAALDTVETFNSMAFSIPVDLFGNDSVIFVRAGDGTSAGGFTLANVTDEAFGDLIIVPLYDDGTGPGDIANDGLYTGSFTLVDDQGLSGQFTDDLADVLDLRDGTIATVVVDIDLTGDSGLAQIWVDFTPPTVIINSGPDTVDLSYVLNATATDVNMDTGQVWYNLDGGQDSNIASQGGNYYEATVDTSSLIEGPHTIRIAAYDIVGNVNRSETVTIMVDHPIPDLDITTSFEPSEPREGDTVVFTVDIENNGDGDANDVNVTLLVDGTEVDQQTETIPIGETRSVQLRWEAEPGQHSIGIEVTDSGARLASVPNIPMDIVATDDPFFDNPFIPVILFILLVIGVIGGIVGAAYLGKETGKAKRAKALPAEEVVVPPQEEPDPCEEIRRKWKAMVAEYQRAKEEKESAGRRAESLREKADQEWKEVDKEKKNAEDAQRSVLKAEMALEDAKQELSGYFANNLLVDGISVGEKKAGLDNHASYFRGVVTVYFRSPAYEEIIKRFVKEFSHIYDELQEDFDKAEKSLRQTQAEAVAAEERVAQAEVEARKVENVARQAEQEHEILKQETENLWEQGEAFRQQWRTCNLKRLSDAVETMENTVQQASEAERGAEDASGIAEYEDYKKKAEDVKSKSEQAKEDAQKIKNRLKEEDMDDGLEEYDDRMERALSDIGSIVERIVGFGVLFRPEPEKLGQPCKGSETMVLNEFAMQYQIFDPTRNITMPDFYETQSGGEAGEALSEFVRVIASINAEAKDVIDDSPEGGLVGVPDDYWPTMMDAGKAALKKDEKKEGGLGFVRTGGLAIPTIQVTITCREVIECKEGTWQKASGRSSVDSAKRGQLKYPKDVAVPYKDAMDWITTRLKNLRDQQIKLKEELST
jgi:hypothetical protein